MPGFRRIGGPSSPVTLIAVIVLLFIIGWVFAYQIGWLRLLK